MHMCMHAHTTHTDTHTHTVYFVFKIEQVTRQSSICSVGGNKSAFFNYKLPLKYSGYKLIILFTPQHVSIMMIIIKCNIYTMSGTAS
jgi:hypothetical protein